MRSCSVRAGLLTSVMALGVSGCNDLAGSSTVPSGTLDPKSYNTVDGVQRQLQGLRTLFGIALNKVILTSGTFTDELTDGSVLDARILPEGGGDSGPGPYANVQDVRVQADITERVIVADSIRVPSAMRGELFAYQGIAEVLLADLYCSGIPLTTLDLNGAINYQPGLPRDSVYRRAVSAFDSALTLSDAASPIMTLARVGKGRALLALGVFDTAAQAVAAVGTADRFAVPVVLGTPALLNGIVEPTDFGTYSVADREGMNGLPYRTDGDRRTAALPYNLPDISNTYYAPVKYQTAFSSDSVAVVVADGVEARLIEAEGALHRGDVGTWLSTLNTVRTDGTVTTTTRVDPTSGDSVGVDTVWNPGTGGVAGLPPLTDPGTAGARVDTLFAERAKWLFLTGHRQGDLRRLIRQYTRLSTRVYPTGAFGIGHAYGDAVTLPIPTDERRNPKFERCFDRNP